MEGMAGLLPKRSRRRSDGGSPPKPRSRLFFAVSPVFLAIFASSVAESACAEGDPIDDPLYVNTGSDAASIKDDSAASLPAKPDTGGSVDPDPDAGGDKDSGGSTIPAACTAALKTATFDFEGDDQGFTHVVSDGAQGSATWPFDPWTRGTSATLACPDGQCFGAERTQNYAQCQRGELISPKIDLSACKSLKVSLVFEHAYAFWSNGSFFDGGIVEISSDDGATWTVPTATYPGTVKINPTINGKSCVLKDSFHVHNKMGFVQNAAASTMTIDIPASAVNDKMRIRFSQASGVSSDTTNAETSRAGTNTGWRIDNVHFTVK